MKKAPAKDKAKTDKKSKVSKGLKTTKARMNAEAEKAEMKALRKIKSTADDMPIFNTERPSKKLLKNKKNVYK